MSTFSDIRKFIEPIYDLIGQEEFTLKEIEDDLPETTQAILDMLVNKRVLIINRISGGIKIYEIQLFYCNLIELARRREERAAIKAEV